MPMPSATPKHTFVKIATDQVLTATLAAVTPATPCANFETIVLSVDYVRNAGSAGGGPVIAVEVSRDSVATTPGAVDHWQPIQYLADASTYTAGNLVADPASWTLTPVTGGTGTYGIPEPLDVSEWFWFRVLMTDTDKLLFGTVSVYFGGV